MKTLFVPAALLLSALACGVAAFAQPPKGGDPKKAPAPKSPADLAWEEFDKVRKEPGAKDQMRFAKVIAAGIAYLAKNPTHSRANDAVRELAFYGNNTIDAKQGALRTSYLSNLRLAVTNERFKDGITEPGVAAMLAVEAATYDAELRASPTPAGLAALREKVDALAEAPQSIGFLRERERSYAHLLIALTAPNFARAEEHLKKMSANADKNLSDMAKAELGIIEARKTPFELKFTGLDGKQIDLAALRGKVVAVYFWSATNKGSVNKLDSLQRVSSGLRKKGLEIVTVCTDKEEDKPKVLAAIKEAGMKLPVYFDGKGGKSAVGKLNVPNAGSLFLLDQKGQLQVSMQGLTLTPNLPVEQIEGQALRLLEPDKKK